jgi:hypothetical protein
MAISARSKLLPRLFGAPGCDAVAIAEREAQLRRQAGGNESDAPRDQRAASAVKRRTAVHG